MNKGEREKKKEDTFAKTVHYRLCLDFNESVNLVLRGKIIKIINSSDTAVGVKISFGFCFERLGKRLV